MINLLQETLEDFKLNKVEEKDIQWVGGDDFHSTWENFKAIANFEYDSGYGAQEIATDLKIVGKDFWFERYEYDGSECWEYKTMPSIPKIKKEIKSLGGGNDIMWCSLSEVEENYEEK